MISAGEFWVADIPYTNQTASKDCLEKSLLVHRLGCISPTDTQNVKSVWMQHVKPQF